MIIGVPKETKQDERRVSLLPDQARELIQLGHKVLIQSLAGGLAGFEDETYKEIGAEIVPLENVYSDSDFILKIKNPSQDELPMYHEGQILFTYLHLDENAPPQYSQSLAETGVSSIAYEWVEDPENTFPLLAPMSELTGILAAKRAVELLTQHAGLLGGRYHPAADAGTVLLIGVGTIGSNALKYFLINGLNVIVVDKHPETVQARVLKSIDKDLWNRSSAFIQKYIRFEEDNFETALKETQEVLPKTNILLNCAVRRSSLPKAKLPYLITRDMVRLMPKRSVLIDATACDNDLIETAVSSASLDYTYIDEGVIHFNCDHLPSLASATATQMLTHKTFPYVQTIANNGFLKAIQMNKGLRRGVMTYEGKFFHPYVCQKKGLPLSAVEDLI